ncbi:hypothetical protein NG799_27995 [Laspinema sp. D1]|uniref:Uncharacterized protein n=1 Tax=Laspinema palackyanum D2a TaxID=2953684 RepID=A0ABT2N3F2_9CYAN|nr:hypothetical protein [Laspinema sp. D2a]
MIEIAQFTTEQAKIYRETINQLNLNFIGQNQPLQNGFPFIIFVKVANELYQASQKFKGYILLALTNDIDALNERIIQRFKRLVGQPCNLNIINSSLVKPLQSGFGISMDYDVLATENCQDIISLRTPEMESNITCLGKEVKKGRNRWSAVG